jgi:hypothetical protein
MLGLEQLTTDYGPLPADHSAFINQHSAMPPSGRRHFLGYLGVLVALVWFVAAVFRRKDQA